MKARNENLTSIDAIMDAEFGKPGTPEREEFRKEAYAYCMGQIICDARKKEKMTQSELAEKIGTNKSYISRITTVQRNFPIESTDHHRSFSSDVLV